MPRSPFQRGKNVDILESAKTAPTDSGKLASHLQTFSRKVKLSPNFVDFAGGRPGVSMGVGIILTF